MEAKTEINSETKQAFHAFAQDFFRHTEINDAVLFLYDKYKLNPNFILFCCWLAREGFSQLSVSDIHFIESRIHTWHDRVVSPLLKMSHRLHPFRNSERFARAHSELQINIDQVAQVEREMLLETTRYLNKEENPKISNLNFALGNIFRYLEAKEISLHKNDLEKIYRITSLSI